MKARDGMKSIFAGNFEPDKAIEAAVDLYGVDATTAVAYCVTRRMDRSPRGRLRILVRYFCAPKGHSAIQ